jgi:hypothetical protein
MSSILKRTLFHKVELFQMERWGVPTQVGQSESANLKHWTSTQLSGLKVC